MKEKSIFKLYEKYPQLNCLIDENRERKEEELLNSKIMCKSNVPEDMICHKVLYKKRNEVY